MFITEKLGEKGELTMGSAIKNYERKTFVLSSETVSKLKKLAEKENRKLNWIVNEILKEYCKKLS